MYEFDDAIVGVEFLYDTSITPSRFLPCGRNDKLYNNKGPVTEGLCCLFQDLNMLKVFTELKLYRTIGVNGKIAHYFTIGNYFAWFKW